jgi:hypothetical protein
MSVTVIANYTLNGVDFHIGSDNPGEVLASIEQIDGEFEGSRFIGDNDTRYLQEPDTDEPVAIQEHIHIHPIAFPFGAPGTEQCEPYGTGSTVAPDDKPKRRGCKPKVDETVTANETVPVIDDNANEGNDEDTEEAE